MRKLWVAVAAGVFGVFAVLTSGANVHFDFTHQNCSSDNFSIVSDCVSLFGDASWDAVFESDTAAEYLERTCTLRLETIACVETAICHCNHSSNHSTQMSGYFASAYFAHAYNNYSQCGNATYGETIESDVFGPIDVTGGVDCAKYNRTIGDFLLTIETINDPMVLDLEATCDGIRTCYGQYDAAAAVMLYQKNLHGFCTIFKELIECVSNASCACHQTNNDTFVEFVEAEKRGYRDTCDIVFEDVRLPYGVVCPGANCKSTDPTHACYMAWYDAYYSSTTTEGDCVAELEWAYCIETLACECGFFNDTYYYSSLARSRLDYENVLECVEVTGPFPDHVGLVCADYGNTTEAERFMILSLASVGYVSSEEAQCPGVLKCYNDTIEALNQAYHDKDIHAICRLQAERYGCLEKTYCDCGLLSDPEVAAKLADDETDFKRSCRSSFIDAKIPNFVCVSAYCNSPQPKYGCLDAWEDAYFSSTTVEGYCLAEKDWADCIERLACECGFHNESSYYRTLAQSRLDYEDNFECVSVTGPFPTHSGLKCKDYGNMTEEEKLLSISLASAGFVDTEEARCQGILQCYNSSLEALSEAYRNKDLQAICQLEAERFGCVDRAYCSCELRWEPDAAEKLKEDEMEFTSWCDSVHIDATIPPAVCYDCDSPNAENTCEKEWYAVNYRSGEELCRALLALANCSENVACYCHFHNETMYLRNLAVAKHNFDSRECSSNYGLSFPNHAGFDCNGDQLTDNDRLLSIALAETDFVRDEDTACPGIKECYTVSDAKATEAYHLKDLSAICDTEEERIQCVEDKYCHCGTLFNPTIYNRTIQHRISHLYLCYDATGFMPVMKCRGKSTCQQENPVNVCDTEFSTEYWIANISSNYAGKCRAFRNVLMCMEEVGCQCGLLVNGSSSSSAVIYSLTTHAHQVFKDMYCSNYVDPLHEPADDGIECAGAPDDDTMRKLVLSYADTAQAAALVTKCNRVHKCFREDDRERAKALYGRDFHLLCKVQRDLVYCLDEAYCRCNMNGTSATEAVITTEIAAHKQYCEDLFHISRQKCVSLEADLERQCQHMKPCLKGVDDKLAAALSTKNYVQYCQEKTTLIHCLDGAFCKCKDNGTENAEDYMGIQMSYHKEYCSEITRKACKTSAADYLRSSVVLAALIILCGIVVR